jgi:hypothetical protein
LPNLVTLFEVNFNLAHACGVAMPPCIAVQCSDGRKSFITLAAGRALRQVVKHVAVAHHQAEGEPGGFFE